MIDNGFEWGLFIAMYSGVGLYRASLLLGKLNGTVEPEDQKEKDGLYKVQSKMDELRSLSGPVVANAILSLILIFTALVWPIPFIEARIRDLVQFFRGKGGDS